VLSAEHHDRTDAKSWFEQAAVEFRKAGAMADHARIRARLRTLGVHTRHWNHQARPVSGWESLTETELAVAALVAEGLSNQQVGRRMFVSHHTVDFHLRQIFRKLAIDSRVVLTRIALTREEVAS
jgi:DNA-binding CsgD family transcriptional regulator